MDFLLELFNIVLQILQTIFVQNFNCKFELMLSAVSSENKECLLTGDMNCNYLVNWDHEDLKSILTSFGLKQLITIPWELHRLCSPWLTSFVAMCHKTSFYSVKAISAGLSNHELIGCACKLNNVKLQPKNMNYLSKLCKLQSPSILWRFEIKEFQECLRIILC